MDIGVQMQNDEEKQAKDQPKTVATGCCGFLQVEYYQPYFNVTEIDVLLRVKATFVPMNPDFQELTKTNPDLWGPIWISATLVFLIAAVGNVANIETKSYDIGYVPESAALLYCIAFGLPVILTLAMKFLGSEIGLFQTICLYGYSMSTLLPITILCGLNYNILDWLLIVYGIVNSGVFLIVNLRTELEKLEVQKKYIVMGVIAAMQIGLYVTAKLLFFRVITTVSK